MKHLRPLKCTALLAGFIFLTGSLEASVLVSYNTAAPTDSFISNPFGPGDTAGSLSWRWTILTEDPPATDKQDIGQAFLSSTAFSLSTITLFTPGASYSSAARPFSLVIEEFAGGTFSSTRSTVATYTGNLNSLGSGSRYVTFTLDAPITLNADTYYGFRLIFDAPVNLPAVESTPASKASMALRTTIGTEPDQFMYYINYGTSPNALSSAQNFEYYIGGAAIPEGGSLALLALGSTALLAVRRLRIAR